MFSTERFLHEIHQNFTSIIVCFAICGTRGIVRVYGCGATVVCGEKCRYSTGSGLDKQWCKCEFCGFNGNVYCLHGVDE